MVDYAPANELMSRAQTQSQEAIKASQGGSTLQNTLRQAITERYGDPLSGQREQAAQTALTAPTNAREYVANMVQGRGMPQSILSPTQQQSVVASRRAADVTPLMTLNDLLRLRTGGVDETIDSGMNAWQSGLGAMQQMANMYQTQGQSMWERLFQQDQAERAASQQAFENDLALQKFNLDKAGSGGGGIRIEDLFGNTITEPKPNAPPKSNGPARMDVSKPFNEGLQQTPLPVSQPNIFQRIWNGIFNPNQAWVDKQVKLQPTNSGSW